MGFNTKLVINKFPELSGKLESLPETFEDWLDHHCEMSPIKHIERKYNENEPTGSYLSDFLKAGAVYGKQLSIENCSSKEPIFISAPTGCGKNYFMEHDILGPLLEKNKDLPTQEHERLLLLSNRVALGRQTKKEIADFIRKRTGDSTYFDTIDSISKKKQKALDRITDFGDMFAFSYQQISSNLANLVDKNIKYVIFDECHFFCSDSVFNPQTCRILNELTSIFSNAVRIYMSSTLETVFEPIIRNEVELSRKNLTNTYDARLPIKYYDVSREYDYLDIKFWEDDEEIIDAITKGSGKWLVFVDSINDGTELQKKINEKLKPSTTYDSENDTSDEEDDTSDEEDDTSDEEDDTSDEEDEEDDTSDEEDEENDTSKKKKKKKPGNSPAEFITAANKGKDSYTSIVNDEKLPKDVRVLIATAVIDNGVNIKDKSVKHIVIGVPDRVEFIQMLGRLRIDDNFKGKINLYIKNFPLKVLKKKWRNDMLTLIGRLEYLSSGKIPTDEQSHMIDISPESDINPLSMYQLLGRIEDLSRMIKSLHPHEKLVLKGADGDRQLQVLDWLLYKCPRYDNLSRRICNALIEVKKDFEQPDVEKNGVNYRYPKIGHLAEKSFLQMIQEKRASALEYDAMKFTEKTKGAIYDESKNQRAEKIFGADFDLDQYSYSKPSSDGMIAINAWNNRKNTSNSLSYADTTIKDKHFKAHLPDKLTDEIWNDDNIWENLKKAQEEEQNQRELPDAAYMEKKYRQYLELSKNELDPDNPVIMEQLHWLDMTVIPPTATFEKPEPSSMTESADENNTTSPDFSRSDVDKLLKKHTIDVKMVKDISGGKKKNDWLRENGYNLKKLESLRNPDANTYDYGKNDGKINGADMLKLFLFFSNYFTKSADTFNKLKNRLSEKPYTFKMPDDDKEYRFTIESVRASKDTIYLFCRAPYTGN